MTHSTQDIIEGDVREAIRRGGLDPLRDREAVQDLVRMAIRRYAAREDDDSTMMDDLDSVSQQVLDDVAGFGPLQRFFDDPEIEEI